MTRTTSPSSPKVFVISTTYFGYFIPYSFPHLELRLLLPIWSKIYLRKHEFQFLKKLTDLVSSLNCYIFQSNDTTFYSHGRLQLTVLLPFASQLQHLLVTPTIWNYLSSRSFLSVTVVIHFPLLWMRGWESRRWGLHNRFFSVLLCCCCFCGGCIIDFFQSCYVVVVFLCSFSFTKYIPLTLAYLLLKMSPCMLCQGWGSNWWTRLP